MTCAKHGKRGHDWRVDPQGWKQYELIYKSGRSDETPTHEPAEVIRESLLHICAKCGEYRYATRKHLLHEVQEWPAVQPPKGVA